MWVKVRVRVFVRATIFYYVSPFFFPPKVTHICQTPFFSPLSRTVTLVPCGAKEWAWKKCASGRCFDGSRPRKKVAGR